jgi:hypothetical protein
MNRIKKQQKHLIRIITASEEHLNKHSVCFQKVQPALSHAYVQASESIKDEFP